MKRLSIFVMILFCATVLVAQDRQPFQWPFAKADTSANKVRNQMLPPTLMRTAEGTIRFRMQNQQQPVALPLQGDVVFSETFVGKAYKTFYKYDENQNITEYYEQFVEDKKPRYQLKCRYKTLTEGEYAGRVVTTFLEEVNYKNNSGTRTVFECDNKGMPLLDESYRYYNGWERTHSFESIVNGNGVRTGVKVDGVVIPMMLFDELGRTKEIRFSKNGVDQFILVTWNSEGLPSEIITNAMDISPRGHALKIQIESYVRKGKNLNIWTLIPVMDVLRFSDVNANDMSLINFVVKTFRIGSGDPEQEQMRVSSSYDAENRKIVLTGVSGGIAYTNEYSLEPDEKGYVSKNDEPGSEIDSYEYHLYNPQGQLTDDYSTGKKTTGEIVYAQGNQYEYQYIPTEGAPTRLDSKKKYFLNYYQNTLNRIFESTETYNYTPWSEPPFVFEERDLSIAVQGKGDCEFIYNQKIVLPYSSKVRKGSDLTLWFNPRMNNSFKSIKVNGVDKTADTFPSIGVSRGLTLSNITENTHVVIEFEEMAGNRHDVNVLIEGNGQVFIDNEKVANNALLKVANQGFIPIRVDGGTQPEPPFLQQNYLQSLRFEGKDIDVDQYPELIVTPVTQSGDLKFVFLPNIKTSNTIVYEGERPPIGAITAHNSAFVIDEQNKFSIESAMPCVLSYNGNADLTLVISKMEVNGVDVTDRFALKHGRISLRGLLTEQSNTIKFMFEQVKTINNVAISAYQPSTDDREFNVALNDVSFQLTPEEPTATGNVRKTVEGWGCYLLFPYGYNSNNPVDVVTSLKVNGVERVAELEKREQPYNDITTLLLRELSDDSTIQIYYNGATNIKNLEMDATVYVQGNQLCLDGLEGNNAVEVYSSNGLLLENRTSTSRNERFTLPSKGLYLLKIGNVTCKVQY